MISTNSLSDQRPLAKVIDFRLQLLRRIGKANLSFPWGDYLGAADGYDLVADHYSSLAEMGILGVEINPK